MEYLFMFFFRMELEWKQVQYYCGLLYQPWIGDGDDGGAVSGMND
jgi:hypothetical protein